jgi:hypothetical protein
VYATSHVYDSKDPLGHQDLNGVIFCDMPWLLNPNEGGTLSARAMDSQIRETPADSVKLIALGLDAYRLVPELPRFRGDSGYRYSGATGTLALQSDNRLQRQLECAQLTGGNPQRRGIAPILQPGKPSALAP